MILVGFFFRWIGHPYLWSIKLGEDLPISSKSKTLFLSFILTNQETVLYPPVCNHTLALTAQLLIHFRKKSTIRKHNESQQKRLLKGTIISNLIFMQQNWNKIKTCHPMKNILLSVNGVGVISKKYLFVYVLWKDGLPMGVKLYTGYNSWSSESW